MHRTFAVILLSACAVAGCDDKRQGTSISINASGTDGNMAAGMDGTTGQVSVNLPGGFAGNIKLPKIKIDADDFDMNGVKLFPGSTIYSLNINARDGKEFEDDDGSVHVEFDAPAEPAKVRDWFLGRLNAAGFSLKADRNTLSGTTDEKKPFRLDLVPNGAGRSTGTIAIGG